MSLLVFTLTLINWTILFSLVFHLKGYVAVQMLLKPTHSLMTLVINSIHQDLISNNENFQALSLGTIANLGGQELSDAVANDVLNIMVNERSKASVKKKVRMY